MVIPVVPGSLQAYWEIGSVCVHPGLFSYHALADWPSCPVASYPAALPPHAIERARF
jgi:hypothetical protein